MDEKDRMVDELMTDRWVNRYKEIWIDQIQAYGRFTGKDR